MIADFHEMLEMWGEPMVGINPTPFVGPDGTEYGLAYFTYCNPEHRNDHATVWEITPLDGESKAAAQIVTFPREDEGAGWLVTALFTDMLRRKAGKK